MQSVTKEASIKQLIQAEVNALGRLTDLLRERSVTRLVKEDSAFASYIGELHDTLTRKSEELMRDHGTVTSI